MQQAPSDLPPSSASSSQSSRNRLKKGRSPSLPSSTTKSNPTALHHRTPTLPSPAASSRTSIDSIALGNSRAARNNHQDTYLQEPQFTPTSKIPTDLLGQRFDSAAIISNLDAVQYPSHEAPPPRLQPIPQLVTQHSDITASRPTQPVHTRSASSTITLANPEVRLSQSLAATGRRMEDIASPHGELGGRSPRQRLSDEVKDTKALKKKSGFSTFMNTLVGTPRRPAISAPENPVHVTHVGYDQETGEFTVCVLK